MRGLMMDVPLTITGIMRHAEAQFPRSEVVSVTAAGLHRCTYEQVFARARRLANALTRLGMEAGDRIGTLAWNDHRHLEIYYAVSCSGAVCHTLNPRLFPEQIAYIAEHAADRWIFADPMFLPLLEQLLPGLPAVEGVVLMCPEGAMPETSLPAVLCYETLLGAESEDFDWPELEERTAAALCYTSGTTGRPKGVLYDHRSTVIHAYAACLPDVMALANRDTVLAVVPMFHANAWALPYSCPLVGAKMVLPGPRMGDPETLHRLIVEEGVTATMGVPTIWLGLLRWLDEHGKDLPGLERMVVGGAACPASLMDAFRDRYGVEVHHSWGMTEMSPLGVFNSPTRETAALPEERREAQRRKQGRGVFGVEMRIVDDAGGELPRDGETPGRLQVRGPWVAGAYYRVDDDPSFTADGWFDTGDVATIDSLGYMQITDRAKDVIKSGGEWISSIELENAAMGHPAVAEAAVIGVPHPRWGERPLLIVVPSGKAAPEPAELIAWLEGRIAKLAIPDEVLVVDALPHTATGKLSKVELRRRYGGRGAERALGETGS